MDLPEGWIAKSSLPAGYELRLEQCNSNTVAISVVRPLWTGQKSVRFREEERHSSKAGPQLCKAKKCNNNTRKIPTSAGMILNCCSRYQK